MIAEIAVIGKLAHAESRGMRTVHQSDIRQVLVQNLSQRKDEQE